MTREKRWWNSVRVKGASPLLAYNSLTPFAQGSGNVNLHSESAQPLASRSPGNRYLRSVIVTVCKLLL